MTNVTEMVTFTAADVKRIRERTTRDVWLEDEADALRHDDYVEQTEPDWC